MRRFDNFEECDQAKDLDSALFPISQTAVCFVKISYSECQELYESPLK